MKNIIFNFILIIFLTSCAYNKSFDNIVNDGEADIEYIDFNRGETAKLSGKWYFWPNRLLDYDVVKSEIDGGFSTYTNYPGIWQKLTPLQPSSELLNRGTLAVKLTIPIINKAWAINMPNNLTATSVYINNLKITEIGKVTSSSKFFIPSNNLEVANFYPTERENILIVHIVNYATPYTGTWKSPTIGLSSFIHDSHEWSIIITALISGALIFMGLYHIALYLLRREDTLPLFFAVICLFMATRNLITGDRILLDLFPETFLGWRVSFNIEHLSAHMTLPLFFCFFCKMFEGYINKKVTRLVTGVAILWAVLQLITPIMVHHRFLPFYEYFILVSAIYIFIAIIRATVKKEDGASIILVGMLFLILTSLNDILLSNGIIQGVYISPLGLFIYTFSQSFYLSKRFSRLFKEVEVFSGELKELNSSLERFIPQEILKYLNKRSIVDVKLGDFSEQEMSVFFLDIRDFTSLSETMSPNDNFKFINSFLKRFGPLIRRCGGFVDKYIGDGIMALFPGTPDDALKAALFIRSTLLRYNNERLGYNLVPLKIGIGINTGNLMLGTIGENQRMDSTVISDAVNTASRLENLTKEINVDILVSENTVKKLQSPDRFRIIHVGDRHLKGKVDNINIYTIDWAD